MPTRGSSSRGWLRGSDAVGATPWTRLIFGAQPGIFAPLRSPALFARVRLDHGAVMWLNGLDLAPDAMYDAIKGQGCWRPGR